MAMSPLILRARVAPYTQVSSEALADAVVATGFAPNEASLRPMARGIAAVGARARTVRMPPSRPPSRR